jgi:histidine triad (HIT) family protein
MSDCLFCRIVAGEIPSHKIYEDDNVLAFLDIYPKTKGHTLVIPKQHAENIFDIPKERLVQVMAVAQQIAKKMPAALGAEGVNFYQSNGSVAQQEIMHYHMHIIPRYQDAQHISFATEYKEKDFEDIVEKMNE